MRRWFKNLSIRNKLIAVILTGTLLSLTFGFAFVLFNDVRTLQREMIDDGVAIARITGESSVSDLAFHDEDEAQRTLAKLAAVPTIEAAYLFDPSGHLFATFHRGKHPPAAPLPAAHPIREFRDHALYVSEPVVYNGETYGTIYVRLSTRALDDKVRTHILTLLAILGALAALSVAFAFRFEKLVSAPILELAATARRISEQHDYSIRVKKNSDDEIGLLSEGFNDMLSQIERRQRERDEADQRTREKSQFLANMSHELRTPLNAIIGFSEILGTRVADRLNEKERRFVENIHSSGQHLLGIVNDILDLSKIEAGKMEINPEEMVVETAIDGVGTLMKGLSGRRNVTIQVQVPEALPRIVADPVKVKQILYNLLSNAVKFSPEGSSVYVRGTRLTAERSPLGEESVELSVIDHGIGIDPKDQQRIFDEFQQVESNLARHFEGTGLGLAIVRRYVEMHAGHLRVDSALGRGSTFTVLLPVEFRGSAVPLPRRQPVEMSSSGSPRVLVIEDEEPAYQTIARQLERAGFTPSHARNGEDGLLLARAIRPVAITLDLVLPGVDGWEVLKTLKNDPGTQPIPVIIVSVIDNRELGLAFGADDYLTKPIDGDRLVSALRKHVKRGMKNVLVIDDDREMHALLDARLRPEGYRLTHAYVGADGVDRAANEEPSLIILDLMMENMAGLELATRLRSDPRTARLPILALTAADVTARERERLQEKITALMARTDLDGSRLTAVVQQLVERQLEA